MKILVITGSPRSGGNSDLLAEYFIKGAKSAGHETTLYPAGRKAFRGCIGCGKCCSKEGHYCAVSDDFDDLAEAIIRADALVLATPLYWFGFPAQLKAALDKLYAFIIGGISVRGKKSALIACGGTGDEGDFAAMIETFRLINKEEQWDDRGHLLVMHASAKGSVSAADLMRAEAFGRTFAVEKNE